MNISQLHSNFSIAGQLEIVAGAGGLPMIKISNRAASALISVYGAQVLAYRPIEQSQDLLFLSDQATYLPGKAIRGGIPVCWPWFGPDPKGLQRPNHGFVRNNFWEVLKTEALSDTETRVSLYFNETLKKENTWRQAFTLILEITVGKTLGLKLTTVNRSEKPFSITQAFHSYFRIGAIEQIEILGLEGADYFDKLDQGTQKNQSGRITVAEEVDRVYVEVSRDLEIIDPVLNRRIHIHAPDTTTAVVWNPWISKTERTPDLGNTDYRHFVCLEAGNVAFDLITIAAGEQYHLKAEYSVLPLLP